jgi:uncharacterized protein (TIGR02284 family)
MSGNEKLTTVLSDLVKINNDRIEGYKQAKMATEDADLKALFQHMVNDSLKHITALNQQLELLGMSAATTIGGRIYDAWAAIKTRFTGTDRYSLFSSCEYGDDAVQRAYAEALSTDVPMPLALRDLIAKQRESVKEAHETIKSYRDVVGQ